MNTTEPDRAPATGRARTSCPRCGGGPLCRDDLDRDCRNCLQCGYLEYPPGVLAAARAESARSAQGRAPKANSSLSGGSTGRRAAPLGLPDGIGEEAPAAVHAALRKGAAIVATHCGRDRGSHCLAN